MENPYYPPTTNPSAPKQPTNTHWFDKLNNLSTSVFKITLLIVGVGTAFVSLLPDAHYKTLGKVFAIVVITLIISIAIKLALIPIGFILGFTEARKKS